MKTSKVKIYVNNTKVPEYKSSGASGFDISVKLNSNELILSSSKIYKLINNLYEDNIEWLYAMYIKTYSIIDRYFITFDHFVHAIYKSIESINDYYDIDYQTYTDLCEYMMENNIHEVNVIPPYSNATFKTGLHFEIAEEDEIQIRTRSGIASKTLLCVKLGTLDSDWRGDTAIIVQNPTPFAYIIIPGMRLAQGVLIEKKHAKFKVVNSVEDLQPTERGDKGLGSTGTN